ncbi:hypothetical protein EZS27_012081 [termite gut metagenome]|uniref:Uncharacterized protein n=1 Tax=termite gut metagenome TaxID=433724 RepID=A0A5J4S1I6_9ZZZZ
MKGNERKKEKKKGKAEGGSLKNVSEYQKDKINKQDTGLNFKPKA